MPYYGGYRSAWQVSVILFNDALLYAEKKVADGGKLSLRRILTPLDKVEKSAGNTCELQVTSPDSPTHLTYLTYSPDLPT